MYKVHLNKNLSTAKKIAQALYSKHFKAKHNFFKLNSKHLFQFKLKNKRASRDCKQIFHTIINMERSQFACKFLTSDILIGSLCASGSVYCTEHEMHTQHYALKK